MSTTMIIEIVAVINDSRRAWSAAALVSTVPASAQGARSTRPTNGSTRNNKATTAGTAISRGTRPRQAPSASGLTTAGSTAGFPPTDMDSGSGLRKARLR
jgi:hypothetical protein